MLGIESFYYLSQILISLIGGVLLLSIYSNIKSRYLSILIEDDSHKRIDKGLLYLSCALFTWVLSGAAGLLESNMLEADAYFVLFELAKNLFSILNNSFILLALFYFYYAPSFVYQNTKNIKLILVIIVIVAISTLLLSFLVENSMNQDINFQAIPDVLLSGFLSVLLAGSLIQTFLKRGFKTIAVISGLVMVLMIGSQLKEVFPNLINDFPNYLIKLVSKTSLIALFLLLATSWVIRLSSTPRIKEMQIRFKDWSSIQLSIPSKSIVNLEIDFKSKTTQFKNLLKLAVRRSYGSGDSVSISVGKAGEISNQTYLSRIVTDINSALDLEENQLLERRDLFTFLGEGRYRLRILSEHIHIDEALLNEFVKSQENKVYKELVSS